MTTAEKDALERAECAEYRVEKAERALHEMKYLLYEALLSQDAEVDCNEQGCGGCWHYPARVALEGWKP